MLTVERMSGASIEDNSSMVQPREVYMGIREENMCYGANLKSF